MGRIRLEKVDGSIYRLTVEGGDHTIGNLLADSLNSMDDVVFAYYEKPHPLEERIFVQFELREGADPRKTISEAVDRVISLNREFRRGFLREVKRLGLELEA